MDFQGFVAIGAILLLQFNQNLAKSTNSFQFTYVPTLHCNQDWQTHGIEGKGLDLIATTALCLDIKTGPKCIGVRCNSSTTYCETLQHSSTNPISCVSNFGKSGGNSFIKSEMVHQQSELVLIDLELGELVPASVTGIPPIPITRVVSSKLKTQVGRDIMTCSVVSKDCRFWTENTNKWHQLPPLRSEHEGGSMDFVGGKVFVVGGRSAHFQNDENVEVFDQLKNLWTLGPPLEPNRRAHSTVVHNDTFLIVVGGFVANSMSSVKMLNVKEMVWSDLPNFPEARHRMICGMVNITLLLCIGGKGNGDVTKTAYGLDFSTSVQTWEMKSKFDFLEESYAGYLIQHRNHVFSLSAITNQKTANAVLRKMDVSKENTTWDDLLLESLDMSFYVVNGYNIQDNP